MFGVAEVIRIEQATNQVKSTKYSEGIKASGLIYATNNNS
jgi:hypothetical protein